MTLHALIDPNDQIIRIEGNIDPSVGTKSGYRWIPVEDIPRPAYDPSVQIAEQITDLLGDRVVRDWQIRDKTENEIQIEKMHRVNGVDLVIMTALLSLENQLRRSSDQDQLTMDQYKIMLRDSI